MSKRTSGGLLRVFGKVGAASAGEFGHAGEDFAHLEGEAVGLGDRADGRIGVAGAQHRGELAVAVEAAVIHLDDEDLAVAGKDSIDLGGERMNVTNLDVTDFLALGASPVHGFADGTVSGTPADEEDIALVVAVDFGTGEFFGELAEFVAAFGGHLHMQRGVAGRVT